MDKDNLILGLDISTKVIGIALFEDLGNKGLVQLLHHVTPKVKPKPKIKMEELLMKADIFDNDFLNNYIDMGIYKVIIEEPLLRSNNVNTIATLLRFNGMLSRAVYQKLGIVPDFISSYDARAFGFPELKAIRTHNKKGEAYTEKQISKNKPVLFGAYPWTVDKKEVVWEKISKLEPQIMWLRDKNGKLKKENFDMADAYAAVIGQMRKEEKWL